MSPYAAPGRLPIDTTALDEFNASTRAAVTENRRREHRESYLESLWAGVGRRDAS